MGDRQMRSRSERGARDDEPHLRIVARRQCADAEQVLPVDEFLQVARPRRGGLRRQTAAWKNRPPQPGEP